MDNVDGSLPAANNPPAPIVVEEDTFVEGFIYGKEIIELNVGGVLYTTTLNTLTKDAESLLTRMFAPDATVSLPKDSKGRLFLDRDGVLFRYILDYLRHGRLVLPDNFYEKDRLKAEAEHFRLHKLMRNLESSPAASKSCSNFSSASLLPVQQNNCTQRHSNQCPSGSMQSLMAPLSPSSDLSSRIAFLTVGYRGTFFGNMGHAEVKDIKFRKLSRILIHGKVAICREVFGETLNESRDPDRGETDRYSSRFFLKHNHLEQAFDDLGLCGFRLICGCASGTNASNEAPKPGSDNEESKWQHYNEFVFQRI